MVADEVIRGGVVAAAASGVEEVVRHEMVEVRHVQLSRVLLLRLLLQGGRQRGGQLNRRQVRQQ